jgi:hypothetical protein
MRTCKDCIFFAPGRHNWGYCDGWVPESSLFNIVDLRSVDNNHLDLEVHADFGCAMFQEESEHYPLDYPEGLD